MLFSGLVVFFCIAGISYILIPRARSWYEQQAWVFVDRMRWYGVRVSPENVVRWIVGGTALTALIIWFFLGNILLALVGAVLVGFAPGFVVSAVQAHRRKRFGSQFVDVLLLMSNSLRAGFNLSQTLHIVANEMPAPAKNEFALVLKDRELGASMEDSLEDLSRRMKTDSVTIFVTAILVTIQTGGDVARMLDKLVTTIRDRERVEDRVRTMTSSGRMQGYIVALLPVLMFLAVYVFSRDSMDAFFSSPVGYVIVFLGVILNVLGLYVIRKMSTVEV